MHKSRGGRGENGGGRSIFVEKGLLESFTHSEVRHAAVAAAGRAGQPAPIMHFRIRRFAGSTTFRSRIDSTSEEFERRRRNRVPSNCTCRAEQLLTNLRLTQSLEDSGRNGHIERPAYLRGG